jgi:hypothetical protein
MSVEELVKPSIFDTDKIKEMKELLVEVNSKVNEFEEDATLK